MSIRALTFIMVTAALSVVGAGVPAAETDVIVGWGGQVVVPDSELRGLVAVAAGYLHSLGLKSDGSIVAWGDNGGGQCSVPAPNSGFAAVAAVDYRSLGLKSDAPSSLSPQTGSLRVTIEPAEALADGARWRRAGATIWRESGETETGIPVGIYRIEFKDAVSWVKLGQLVFVSPLGTDAVILGYRPYRIGETNRTADATLVRIDPATVTAAWDGVFYMQAPDRCSGIRVEKASHGMGQNRSIRILVVRS